MNCVASKLTAIEKYLGKGKIKVTQLIPKGKCATVGTKKKNFCEIWTQDLYVDNNKLNTTTTTGILNLVENSGVTSNLVAYQNGNIVIISGYITTLNGDAFNNKCIGSIIGLPLPTIPVFQSLSIFSDSFNGVQAKLEYPHMLGSQVQLCLLTSGEIASETKIYINGSYVLSAPPYIPSQGTPFPF